MVRNPSRQTDQSLSHQSVGFVGSDGALPVPSSEQGRARGEPAAPAGWPLARDRTSPGLRSALGPLSEPTGECELLCALQCASRAALTTLLWAAGICLYIPSVR